MTQCKCYGTALCSGIYTHTHRVQGPCLMMWGSVGLHTPIMTQCNCYCMHCIGYLRAKHFERAECLEGCRDLMQEFSLYVCVRSTVVMMAFTHIGHLMGMYAKTLIVLSPRLPHCVLGATHTHTKCRDLV